MRTMFSHQLKNLDPDKYPMIAPDEAVAVMHKALADGASMDEIVVGRKDEGFIRLANEVVPREGREPGCWMLVERDWRGDDGRRRVEVRYFRPIGECRGEG
jgi:hypothetical protein